jgi:hypothetical protein
VKPKDNSDDRMVGTCTIVVDVDVVADDDDGCGMVS